MNHKQRLRAELLRGRNSLSAAEACSLSDRVRHRALHLPSFVRARNIGLYMSVNNEVDTVALLTEVLERGKRVALPSVIPGTKTLRFFRFRQGDSLVQGPFGIPEPRAREEDRATPLAWFDLIFTPLVGFDRQGGRLGYGGGFFDRFLATGPRPILIGLAYGFQETRAAPREPHDILLDQVVTENGLIDCRRNRRS